MATFNANQADNYGGQGGGGFFSLKNDKDTAVVRFMYNSLEDIEGYAVHEVEVDGKKRYVNCLRNYNDPVDACPLCAAKYKVLAKLFVQVYDVDADEVKIWDRGKSFFSKLTSLCTRYNPLVSTPFEVERNGKKGDTSTTYETYPLDTDDMTLEDLPEAQPLLGGLILDKSAEELDFFLDNGFFEEATEAPQASRGAGRNPANDREASNKASEPRRRTPASTTTSNRRPQNQSTPTRTPASGRSRNSSSDRF